ncbi:MAG: T9SS type A sorting domain-containing protein [Bacteroidota bacterium]
MKKLHNPMLIQWIIVLLLITIGTKHSDAQINCDAGVFYGIASDRSVYPMTISGSTIILGTPVVAANSNAKYGIAIADLGLGNTFYSSGTTSIALDYDILEYDGTAWQTVLLNPYPNSLHNSGGRGNYLYYQYIGSSNQTGVDRVSKIFRYSGGVLTSVFADSTVFQKVADIAVDNSGNVYFFSGNVQYPNTDVSQLNIISSTGNLLATYPVTFDGSNAYGCFIENNILYVGIGPANAVNPNSLLPITISGGTATIGTAIPVPHPIIGGTIGQPAYLNFSDLASCTDQETFISNPIEVAGNDITLYPNPVTDYLNIYKADPGISILKIYDVTGRIIFSETLTAENTIVDLDEQPKGMYTVQIISGSKITNHKIIKK